MKVKSQHYIHHAAYKCMSMTLCLEYTQTLLESEVTEIAASLSNPLSLAGQGAAKTGSTGVTQELATVRTSEQSRKFQENFL